MKTLRKTSLFWDVDLKSLDPKKHDFFIIERILNLGGMDDYKWMVESYSIDKIRKVIRESRRLDLKSLIFWSNKFGLNYKQTRCFRLHYQKTADRFWPY